MFEGRAEEAMQLYTSLFEDGRILELVAPSPGRGRGVGARALFTIAGQRSTAATATCSTISFTPSTSLFVDFDTEQELVRVLER